MGQRYRGKKQNHFIEWIIAGLLVVFIFNSGFRNGVIKQASSFNQVAGNQSDATTTSHPDQKIKVPSLSLIGDHSQFDKKTGI